MDTIKNFAYAKYQMFWMIRSGISLADISTAATNWFDERFADQNNEVSFSDYLEFCKFGENIWKSFDEFLAGEYQDREYMKEILTEDQFKVYLDDIGDGYVKFSEAKDLIEQCIKREILQADGDMILICRSKGWFMEPKDFIAKELMYDKEGRDTLLDALEKRNGKEKITEFKGDYSFLSNFYPCVFTYADIIYQNAEAAFQAQKTMDPELRKKFSYLKADQAKHQGKRVDLRPDWERVKVSIMQEVLYAKFTQNKPLAIKLLETDDRELIEGNTWHDNTWGKCSCAKCQQKEQRNLLGKCLMELRSTLKDHPLYRYEEADK